MTGTEESSYVEIIEDKPLVIYRYEELEIFAKVKHLICIGLNSFEEKATSEVFVHWSSSIVQSTNGSNLGFDILATNPKRDYTKTNVDKFVSIYFEPYSTDANTTYEI